MTNRLNLESLRELVQVNYEYYLVEGDENFLDAALKTGFIEKRFITKEDLTNNKLKDIIFTNVLNDSEPKVGDYYFYFLSVEELKEKFNAKLSKGKWPIGALKNLYGDGFDQGYESAMAYDDLISRKSSKKIKNYWKQTSINNLKFIEDKETNYG